MRVDHALKTEITGRHVLFAMIGFFLIVTAVDALMIYKALSTFGGVETQDAYRKGLQYNQSIDRARAQDALGWSDKTALDPSTGRLQAAFTDGAGAPIDGLTVKAGIGRPATNAQDQTVTLAAAGPGLYAFDVSGLEPGTWIVSLQAEKPGPDGTTQSYRSKVRIWKAP